MDVYWKRDTHGRVDNVKKEYLYCCRLEQDNNINKINIRHGSGSTEIGDLLLEQSRGKVVLEDSTIDENDFRNISESGAVFVFERSVFK